MRRAALPLLLRHEERNQFFDGGKDKQGDGYELAVELLPVEPAVECDHFWRGDELGGVTQQKGRVLSLPKRF